MSIQTEGGMTYSKSNVSALIGVLKHLQTCHYCSSWNEHQKSGRSPIVTFRKLLYYHFDISNSLRFKHAIFEDSQFLENVKNKTDTLPRGGFAYILSNSFLIKSDGAQDTSNLNLKKNVSVLFLFCGLCVYASVKRSLKYNARYSLW